MAVVRAYREGAYYKEGGISSRVGINSRVSIGGRIGIGGRVGIGASPGKDVFRPSLLLYRALSIVYSGGVDK
jgi:hypothetical protein